MYIILVFSTLIIGSLTLSTSDYEDCATQMSTLEHALYETEDNIFELNKVFYPPSKRTSRFIRVTYIFLDEFGGEDGCNVTYIWGIGGFLFFQPPSIFELNSLFFNYPNNNLTSVDVKLPHDCRPLIQANESSAVCSCLKDSERLDILTQQINVYAKYLDRATVIREKTFARAICSEELHDRYYNANPIFTFIIVCFTILFPIFTIMFLVTAMQKIDDYFVNAYTQPTAHPSLVAMVLTGTMMSIAILMVNIFACMHVVNATHEYSDLIKGHPINLYIIFGTLVLNIIFSLPLLFCVLYITICFNGRGLIQWCCKSIPCTLTPCISGVVSYLIGGNNFNKVATLTGSKVISWMFPIMLVTPILCLSSHLGYILLAWLTEPSKATTTFLIYYMVGLYFFFTFRKCYMCHSKVNISFTRCKRKRQEAREGDSIELDSLTERPQETSLELEESLEGTIHKPRKIWGRYEKEHINTQAFCLLIFYGILIAGGAATIVLSFVLLPFSSEQLITYVFQLLQLIVVLISTQIVYSFFFSDSFSLRNIVKKFKEVYAKNTEHDNLAKIAKQNNKELCDVAGEFAAELTNVIVQKPLSPMSLSATESIRKETEF